jgi:hypothetical protein
MKISRLLTAVTAISVVLLGLTVPAAEATDTRQHMAQLAQTEYDKDPDSYRVQSDYQCNFYSGQVDGGSGCDGHSGWGYGDWCADFVRYIWGRAGGVRGMSRLDSYAESFKTYGIAEGTWHPVGGTAYTPKPGDAVVYMDDGGIRGKADHVGMVESYSNGTLTTIEGNWSYRVSKRVNPTRIQGFTEPVVTDSGGSKHDFTGEGRDDVVAVTKSANGGTSLTLYAGGGTGASPTLSWKGTGGSDNLPFDSTKFTVGEVNGDDKSDVVWLGPTSTGGTQFGVFRGNGTGFDGSVFAGSTSLPLAGAQYVTGDFTDDERDDLVAITKSANGGTSLTLYAGGGTATAPNFTWKGTGGSDNLPFDSTKFTVANANGDNKDDVVWLGPTPTGGTQFGVFRSNGAGFDGSVFAGSTSLSMAGAQYVTGHFTDDDRDDLVAITKSANGGTSLTLYAGGGTATAPSFTWKGTGGSDNLPFDSTKFSVGEANGDHRDDVMWMGATSTGGTQFGVFRCNGTGFDGSVFAGNTALTFNGALFPYGG